MDEVRFDPAGTALLVIDMQNGFVHPEGAQGKAGHDMSTYPAIVDTVGSLVDASHEAGMHVLWSQQVHFPDDVTRARKKVPSHLAKLGMIPCLRGTWDAEIYDGLKPRVAEQDDVFVKHRASCFYDTTLGTNLRMRGVTALIITGVTTNYCVEATIRDAYARDFDLYVVDDACAAPWPEQHQAVMRNVDIFFGRRVTTEEVLAGIRASGGGTGGAPLEDEPSTPSPQGR